MAYITKQEQKVQVNPDYSAKVVARINERKQTTEEDGSITWYVDGGFYYEQNGIERLFRAFSRFFTNEQVGAFWEAHKNQIGDKFPELYDDLTQVILLQIIVQDKATNFNLDANGWEVYNG